MGPRSGRGPTNLAADRVKRVVVRLRSVNPSSGEGRIWQQGSFRLAYILLDARARDFRNRADRSGISSRPLRLLFLRSVADQEEPVLPRPIVTVCKHGFDGRRAADAAPGEVAGPRRRQ